MGDPLFFLLLPFAYVVFALVSINPANEHYDKGMEFISKSNYFEAEQFFLKAINADPLHTPSISELAKLYEAQGMVDKALHYYKLLLTILPNPYDQKGLAALMRVGEIHYLSSRYKESWECFLLALRTGYKAPDLFYYLGELYMVQRRYAEAINFFNESLEMEPSQPKVTYYKAICLISLKERTEAITPLQRLEKDPEFGSRALYLLGKIYYDNDQREDAYKVFAQVLKDKNPLHLKDILFYQGYEILHKEDLDEEDLNRLITLFNRGAHLKNTYSEVKKEFLYHQGGAYLMKKQFNEAKMVFRDLCRIDAYYKSSDQILKTISKEMLIKEEQEGVVELYKKYMKTGHYQHQIQTPLRIEDFYPTHLPLLVLEKLEESAQKKLLQSIRDNEAVAAKFDFLNPKNPIELSKAPYDIFLDATQNLCEKKMGIVVGKNMSENKNDACYLGIDKDEIKCLVYVYKPAAIVGAISVMDILDKKERIGAKRLIYVSCGSFTDDAREVAKKNNIILYDKENLTKILR